MNEALLKCFSPSVQKALRLLAATPEDSAHFYNRLTIFRTALLIGGEVMEQNCRIKAKQGFEAEAMVLQDAHRSTLGVLSALEFAMTTLEGLHPELAKINLTSPKTPKGLPGINGREGEIRKLDLDQ